MSASQGRIGTSEGHRGVALLTGALLAAFLVVGPLAASSRATELGLRFASKRPGTTTAMTLHIHYTKPGDPNAKPPAIRQLQIDAPAGTVFHSSDVPACEASDAEAMALGPRACPSESRIGGGPITIITGFGKPFDPYVSPTPTFNDGRGWLEISQDSSGNSTIAVTREAVTGSRISGTIAQAPGGPPDGESAVSTVDLSFPGSTGYVTTPRTCPPDGHWVTTGRFTFSDGTTQVARGETACVTASTTGPPPHAHPARPAAKIRVRLRPRRVRAGRRVRLRVALSSTDRRCISRATVRLRGRRARRTNGSGRATIKARFRRSGRRWVVVSKPGCRPARRSLIVRRRT